MKFLAVIRSSRPPFLLLTVICVALGVALARAQGADLDPGLIALILLCALSAHISVNALNEWHDFKTGLDLVAVRTPFSGGSGALPEYPAAARGVLLLGVFALLVAIVSGLYLAMQAGPELLIAGALGIALVLAYTPWINRSPLLCLVAPGTGFGLLMGLGTCWLLVGSLTWWAIAIALVPFFLINNILLLNQYPDIDADNSVGRRTFPIVYGVGASTGVCLFFTILAYGIALALVVLALLPWMALILVLPFALGLWSARGAWELGESLGSRPAFLGANVASVQLATAILAASLWWG